MAAIKPTTSNQNSLAFTNVIRRSWKAGRPEENAEITLKILDGEKGPRRDAVVLNSGAALYIAGRAESMEEGVRMAEVIIDSGKAKRKLEELPPVPEARRIGYDIGSHSG